jgi:hypothetical protein
MTNIFNNAGVLAYTYRRKSGVELFLFTRHFEEISQLISQKQDNPNPIGK